MEILNYKSIENCYVCGSIDNGIEKFISRIIKSLPNGGEDFVHPKELERQERLKRKSQGSMSIADLHGAIMGNGIENDIAPSPFRNLQPKKSKSSRNNFNNAVMIVCGNCGIGIKSEDFYKSIFNRFNNILAKNNCHILFVRGNNDNPSFFEEDKLNLSNIKCVKDYTVVQLKRFNCLCIGGGVSIDKKWKILQGERLGKKLYWENEGVVYDEDKLNKITSKYNIACVATCSSPSFAFPGTNAFSRSKWVAENNQVSNELMEERKVMDKIYSKLTENGMKPYMWFYDKFNKSAKNNINDMVFWSMCPYNIISFNEALTENFGIDISKKLATNTNSFNKLFNEDSTFPLDIGPLEEPMNMMEEPREELNDAMQDDNVEEEGEELMVQPGEEHNELTIDIENIAAAPQGRRDDFERYWEPRAMEHQRQEIYNRLIEEATAIDRATEVNAAYVLRDNNNPW